jgi:hypothetical protein
VPRDAGTTEDRRAWWSVQRGPYNVALAVAFPISVISLFVVWALFEERLPCFEINGAGLFFGIILFGFGMGLANICYLLGPLSERLIRPRYPTLFRRWVFGIGLAFSLLLVFFPVGVTLTNALLGPLPCTDEFGQKRP